MSVQSAIALALLVFAPRPSPSKEAATPLQWQAPSECPGAGQVRGRVERLLGQRWPTGSVEASGRVAAIPVGWRLHLVLRSAAGTDERELVGETCRELAEAAALIIAASIRPERGSESVGGTRPRDTKGRAARSGAQELSGTGSASVARPGARELSDTGPASIARPRVRGRSDTGSARVARPRAQDDAVAAPNDAERGQVAANRPNAVGRPAKRSPAKPAKAGSNVRHAGRPSASRSSRGTLEHGVLRASGAVDHGTLGSVGGAAKLAMGLAWKWVRLELVGGYWPPRRNTLRTGAGARSSLGAVEVRGCGRVRWTRLEIPLCLGMETGAYRSVGFGLQDARRSHAPWLAVVLSPSLAITLHPRVAFVLEAQGWAALLRPRVVHTPVGEGTRTIYRVPVAGARVGLGIEFRL